MSAFIAALNPALDATAPDTEEWIAGREQFYATLEKPGSTWNDAVCAALDVACAGDAERWTAGYAVFAPHLEEEAPAATRAVKAVKTGGAKFKEFAQRLGFTRKAK